MIQKSIYSMLMLIGVAHAQVNLDFYNSAEGAGGLLRDATQISGSGYTAGSVFVFENVAEEGGTNYDVTITLDTIVGGVVDRVSGIDVANSLYIQLTASAANPYVVFTMDVYEGDSTRFNINDVSDLPGSTSAISNLSLLGFDIDSQNSGSPRNYTDILGYSDSLSPTVQLSSTTNLEQAGFESGGPSNFISYRTQQIAGAWTDVGNDDPFDGDVSADYAVDMNFSSFSSGTFVWGVTGPESSTSSVRGMLLNGTNPPVVVIPELGTFSCVLIAFAPLLLIRVYKRRFRS